MVKEIFLLQYWARLDGAKRDMKKKRIVEAGKVSASLIIALIAVQLIGGCEDPTGPECGSLC